MPLELSGYIALPANDGEGGFDHADVHAPSDRLYVAHTGNSALDVIDCARERYVESVPGLTGVAGALVSEARGLVFTSNRGEDTVSMFRPGAEGEAVKIGVGAKPNGLSFDAERGILVAANFGALSVVDVEAKERIAEIAMPGRTRWTVYHPARDRFYVNIAAPAKILAIDGRNPRQVAAELDIPAAGPHGLDMDSAGERLFCACDAGVLVAVDVKSGRIVDDVPLSGAPDVIFLHHETGLLYVAIGDPGVIDVIDTKSMRRVQTIATEPGAHTLALDRKRRKVFAFLPGTHRAAVYREA
jgi:DNA-binding beta-propeller fold protein YncE